MGGGVNLAHPFILASCCIPVISNKSRFLPPPLFLLKFGFY